MSKKPTKKDLEAKLQQKEKEVQTLESTIKDMRTQHTQLRTEAQEKTAAMVAQGRAQDALVREHKKNEEKTKEGIILWKSAYYDLKDRTTDLEHRMEAVREMVTTGIADLPEDQEEKEKAIDSVLGKVLRYIVKLENKVHMSMADAIEVALDKVNDNHRFKQTWDSFS